MASFSQNKQQQHLANRNIHFQLSQQPSLRGNQQQSVSQERSLQQQQQHHQYQMNASMGYSQGIPSAVGEGMNKKMNNMGRQNANNNNNGYGSRQVMDTSPMRVTLNLWEAGGSNNNRQGNQENKVGRMGKDSNLVNQGNPIYGSNAQPKTLIKQAQMKRNATSNMQQLNQDNQKIAVQFAFANRIDNFEGDNDHVDEEFESSAEKSKLSVSPSKEVNNHQGIPQKNIEFSLQSPNDQQMIEDGSEGYALSSESKQYRLSFTPNCDVTERSGHESSNVKQSKDKNRIFSDLSAKVVNINNGGANIQNPFITHHQQTIQSQKNNEQSVQNHMNHLNHPSFPDYDNAYSSNNDYVNLQTHQTNNQIQNTSMFFKQNETKYLNSEICNYDSTQVQVQQNQNFNQQSRSQSITPFDMLRQEYMIQRNQVIDKYQSLEESQQKINEHEEDQKNREEEQEQNFYQNDNENEKTLIATRQDSSKHEPLFDQAKNEQATQDPQQTNQDSPKQIQKTPKPQQKLQEPQISESTQGFFNGLQQKDQEQTLKNLAGRLTEDRFLTFDDFLKRKSNQNAEKSKNQQQNSDSLEQVKQHRNTVDDIQNYKSPRTNLIDMNEIQRKERDQENKKKREIEMLKQKAKEKEQLRVRRLQSAIMIQKWIRGHIVRKEFRKKQINYRFMRKFRRIMAIAYYKHRSKFLSQLITTLKQVHQQKKSEEEEIYQKYLELCVVMIQKTWRGYRLRHSVIPKLINKYRINRALIAIVKGWKIRRILSGCREVISIKRELAEIQNEFRKVTRPKDPIVPQLMNVKRRKIEELIKLVPALYKNGRWLYSQQKMLQNLKSTAKLSQNTKASFKNMPHTGIKSQYFQSQQQQNRQQSSNNLQNQLVFDQFEMEDNYYQMKQNLQYQERPTYKADVQGYQQKNYFQQNNGNFNEEEASQSVIWPSQKQQHPNNYNNNGGMSNRDKEENSNNANAAVVWPSQRSAESSVIVWPSQRVGEATATATQNINANKDQSNRSRGDQRQSNNLFSERNTYNDNNNDYDLQYTQRTAVAEKLQTLDESKPANKYQFKQQLEQMNNSGFSTNKQTIQNRNSYNQYSEEKKDEFEERNQSRRSPIKKHFVEDDERPIKGAQNYQYQQNLSDEGEGSDQEVIKPPKKQVKQHKKSNQPKVNDFDDRPIPAAVAAKRNPQFDDDILSEDGYKTGGDNRPLPIKHNSQHNTNQSQSKDEDSPIKAPSYNFEEMLEKALQDQSGAPNQAKKNQMSAQRRAKTTRGDQSDDQIDDDQPKTKKAEVKQNLKKRQKYDPRKAIEEAKKNENKEKAQAKSAFPEGLLGNKADRVRSQTSKPTNDDTEEDNKSKSNAPMSKRKTQKQAQMEKEEVQLQEKNAQNDDVQSEMQSSTNASNQPKNFLKRKDKAKPVIQGKVTWKVESKINCWTNKDTRSNNQSQTRRKTSQLRSPKQTIPIAKQAPQEEAKVTNQKKANNLQQTPPPPKKKATQPPTQIKTQQVPLQQDAPVQLRQLNQQLIQSQYSQVPIQIAQQQTIQLSNLTAKNMMNLPMQMNNNEKMQDEIFENDSIPDENDLIDSNHETFNQDQQAVQQQNTQFTPHYQNTYNQVISSQQPAFNQGPQLNAAYLQQQQNQQYLQQQDYQQMQQQQFSDNLNNIYTAIDDYSASMNTHNNFNQNQPNDNATLELAELEKVFQMFHPVRQSFESSMIRETPRETFIPHMTMNSMFFSCYSDDIYDTILEDLRDHYLMLCNE